MTELEMLQEKLETIRRMLVCGKTSPEYPDNLLGLIDDVLETIEGTSNDNANPIL